MMQWRKNTMGMKEPFVSEIAPDTFAINEYGLDAIYLLVGSERALVIDTGSGAFDLKGLVESLTDKPYDVVLTHGHIDHAGGMRQFSDIYLNKNDLEMACSINQDEVKNYLDMLGKMGGYEVYDYTVDSLRNFDGEPNFHFINDGYVFDLGDRRIIGYSIPGHTPGGMVFLDRKNRILFSGDCCNVNLLIGGVSGGSSVTTTLRAIRRVIALQDEFDQNFNGHIGYAGLPNCFSQPKSVPQDLEWICEAILQHKITPHKVSFLGKNFMQAEHGSARLSYNPDRLLDPGEEPIKV